MGKAFDLGGKTGSGIGFSSICFSTKLILSKFNVDNKNFPVPMEFVGVQDSFGESGKSNKLFKKYGLTSTDIVEAVKRVILRKNS